MLGLLFGGGQLRLGGVFNALALLILEALKQVEFVPRSHGGTLTLNFVEGASSEREIRELIRGHLCHIQPWTVRYATPSQLVFLRCEIQWQANTRKTPETPSRLAQLRSLPGIIDFGWNE